GLAVLLNTGGGALMVTTQPLRGFCGDVLLAADLDGDGALDLASTCGNPQSSWIEVVLNHGDGTFGATLVYEAGKTSWSLAKADLDGNARTDVVVATAAKVTTLLNTCVR